jgi:DNA-binding NtrC family response regulator
MPTVLVVDDDRMVLCLIKKAFCERGTDVWTATTAAQGLDEVRRHHPDVVLLDVKLPDLSGLDIVDQVRDVDPDVPLVYITVSEASDVVIQAMTLGAYDVLLKPLDIEHVQDVVERALEARRAAQLPVKLSEMGEHEPTDGDHLVLFGRSPPMLEAYKEIGRVAAQDVTVQICGESGTGKELVARAIHQHSHRKEFPFLAVNCAALTETLLESDLFGHEKGAFTGADRRRIGKFEQCNRGTIFLDEVGDMSPLVQSKALRLLQEQTFERVGGTETIQTDVRILAATNRELERMVAQGEFRLDLFHRLNDYRIDLPPLRARGDDIVLLTEHFLVTFSKALGKPIHGVSPEALAMLRQHAWPGNVRELQTVLKKAVLRATAPVLVPDFLPESVKGKPVLRGEPPTEFDSPPSDLKQFVDDRWSVGSCNLHGETVEMMERYLITRVLREAEGNQSRAAERLGITRGSLRHKIRALGIVIEHVVQAGPSEGE